VVESDGLTSEEQLSILKMMASELQGAGSHESGRENLAGVIAAAERLDPGTADRLRRRSASGPDLLDGDRP